MQFRTSAITICALFSLVLLSSTSSFAQNAKAATSSKQKAAPSSTVSSAVNTTVAAPKPPEPKPFSISLGLGRTRNLYNFQDGTVYESTDFQMIPSYKWSLGVTAVVLGYSQDERYPENSDISDIVIAQSFKGWDLGRIKLSPGLSATIPQSRVSRELKNLEFAMGGKLTASIKPEYLLKGVGLRASVSVNRSFPRYDTAVNGSVSNLYSSKQGIGAGYEIGRFSFDIDLSHSNSWSYNGKMREAYEHNESATVAFADYYSFTIGHTNGGSVYKPNGYESNYRLIDENNSMVYAQLGLQY